MREQWVLQPASLRSEGGATQRQQPIKTTPAALECVPPCSASHLRC